MPQTVIFTALSLVFSAGLYVYYLWTVFRGETRPHIFSWINWGIVVTVGASAQYSLGAGLSALALGFIALMCFVNVAVGFWVSRFKITQEDWLAFLAALATVPVWAFTRNPLAALFLVIIIDAFSFFPTFRKSFQQPYSEPPLFYFVAGLRYFFTIFTVADPSFKTLLYPVFLTLPEWTTCVYILWRRHRLKDKAA
ncbi:MAG: hypothetical protein GC129_03625 [Proteobacteria bacterium]|nr:hypothetical protein [Pseudomonadota bacterium]